MTKEVISLSISVLLLFRHYISHKITFGAPSSGGVLCSACGAFIVQSSSSTGGNISLTLYESTESCESLLQVEWQPDLSSQQNTFSLDYGLQVDIM